MRDTPNSIPKQRELPYSRSIPLPTSGPLTSAFGVSLMAAGLVTNAWVLGFGVIAAIVGLVIWFRDVFPEEQLEPIPAELLAKKGRTFAVETAGVLVERPMFPAQVHPYRGGIVGGLLGGIAMAIVACAWGLFKHESVWLPINLLTGAVAPGVQQSDLATLSVFHAGWFGLAIGIHLVMSIAVGLLYTTALPMMPQRPVFAGGILVPVMVTGLVWASLGVVNPALEQFISWPWFISSQVAFGVTCGWWVGRTEMVRAMASRPLAQRLQVERGDDK